MEPLDKRCEQYPAGAEGPLPCVGQLVKAEEAVMTVRLEIKPEIAASLNAQAAAKGMTLDAYLQDVIEDLARAQAAPAANL